jgi:hypothetical protein
VCGVAHDDHEESGIQRGISLARDLLMLDLEYLVVPDDDEPDALPVIEEESYGEDTTVEIVVLDAWLGGDDISTSALHLERAEKSQSTSAA